ncbi:fumarylacetoacetate hydrolase family protein [bacterium]|nr:fumarylacetoacetate hydrolase family protein [bacterium]
MAKTLEESWTGPGLDPAEVIWHTPVTPVSSFRDFYAFEQHVKTARAKRDLEVAPEWYKMPVFYFSNHGAIFAHEAEIPLPAFREELDFELEVAAVIGRDGRDIPVESAEEHIAGYTILNDWSSRAIQRREMSVGLGPAKGKDFASQIGPFMVTPDELVDTKSGKGFDLAMTARVNGQELSRGNWKSIHWSFADMVAHASAGVELQSGDLIGSGTVGTGCLLEIGTKQLGRWLAPGDVVELEIERLGVLRGRLAKE